MGELLMGSARHVGDAPLMTGGQSDLLNQLIQQYSQQMGQGQDQYQDLFQQSFIDPAMRTFEQQTVPAIQQRFADAGASSSSALNQALGQSAADLNTMLGSQMGQFQQTQQFGLMQFLNQLLGQRAFDPIVQQRQGILGPMIGAAGSAGAALI